MPVGDKPFGARHFMGNALRGTRINRRFLSEYSRRKNEPYFSSGNFMVHHFERSFDHLNYGFWTAKKKGPFSPRERLYVLKNTIRFSSYIEMGVKAICSHPHQIKARTDSLSSNTAPPKILL